MQTIGRATEKVLHYDLLPPNDSDSSYRKEWVKKQRITHSYGAHDEDEEDDYIDQSVLQANALNGADPPSYPSVLPNLDPKNVQVFLGGKGCKKCGSLTHQRSSHMDCPFNKRRQTAAVKQTTTLSTQQACKKCGSTSHQRSNHKDCPFRKKTGKATFVGDKTIMKRPVRKRMKAKVMEVKKTMKVKETMKKTMIVKMMKVKETMKRTMKHVWKKIKTKTELMKMMKIPYAFLLYVQQVSLVRDVEV